MSKDKLLTLFIISVIATILSSGITSLIFSSNPDVTVTLLEKKDSQHLTSHLYSIVQNTGTSQANNLKLYYDIPAPYTLKFFNSTESIPKLVLGDDNKSRIDIDRMSESSYTILNMQGKMTNSSKKLFITYDGGSKTVTLPYSINDTGVTTSSFWSNRISSYAMEGAIGAILISIVRYTGYRISEFRRHEYLGTYSIDITKFDLKKVLKSFLIILIAMSIVIIIEYNVTPRYLLNIPFSINNSTIVDQFIHVKNPDPTTEFIQTHISLGNIALFLAIIGAIGYSGVDLRQIEFRWFIKSKISNIKVGDISSSYLPFKRIMLNDEIDMNSQEKNHDFFYVVYDHMKGQNKIVALLANDELIYVHSPSDKSAMAVLLNPDLPKPRWSFKGHKRDNFIKIDEANTLDFLKNQMEETSKKYAVVIDIHNNPIGIIDYDLVFKK